MRSACWYVGTYKVPNQPNVSAKYYDARYDITADGAISSGDQGRLAAAYDSACPTTVYRYTYDGDGTLLKRAKYNRGQDTATPVETVAYIGGIYEAKGASITKYYSMGGQRIAMRQGSTTTYLHGDHLGSTSVATNATGCTAAAPLSFLTMTEPVHVEGRGS